MLLTLNPQPSTLNLRQLRRIDQKEPVAAPRDVSRHGADSFDLDGHVVSEPVTRDVLKTDAVRAVVVERDEADRRFEAMRSSLDPPEMPERHAESNRPVPAHPECPDVVEEDHSRDVGRINRFAQQGTDDHIRPTRLIDHR